MQEEQKQAQSATGGADSAPDAAPVPETSAVTETVTERTETPAPDYPSTSAQEVVDEVHEQAEQPVVTETQTTETVITDGGAAADQAGD